MDITGLAVDEISDRLKRYVEGYFRDCVIMNDSSRWFSESYLLHFEEVSHLLRLDKYSGAFSEGDKFNCAAGIVEIYPLIKYVIMLVSTEDHSKALFLYLQVPNPNTGETRDILLKDFVRQA